ncbi:hypothetical protein V490_02828 [Pseudogymnoascus sp. VKM F-3557]|nr:hypothetical protein V490_02828 [Pseudogymnoascus sp. VKM F-3557]
MASTNLFSLEPLEAYVSPDELADELVLQKTLLFTLDSTAEGSEQAKAEIEAEIARIETQLRELRGGITEPHIGASVLGGSSQQHRPNNIESSSPFSSYNLGPFSSDSQRRDAMNPSYPSLGTAAGSTETKDSIAKFSLPSRKRSFEGLHGLDSSRQSGSKSRRTSPSPSNGAPASYTNSYTDSSHADPVTRELELHKIRQKEIEDAAAKSKKDGEYARRLQDRYSARTSPLSGNRPAPSTRPSAYDRLMGTLPQPPPSRPQKDESRNTNSHENEVSALEQGPQLGQRSHGYQPVDLAASISTLGSESHSSKMPGSFPDQDSDSDIEVISSADFRENGRQQHLSRRPPPANMGYGSYPSYTPQGPSSGWPPTQPYLNGYATNNTYYPGTYGQSISNAYPGLTSGAMNAPLAQILNQTSAVDLAAMRDRLNQGLAGEIYNYVTDPRKTEKEIQDLLENIRPDTEIPVEDREGTPEGLKYPLYEHQKLALTWLKSMEEGSNKGGILADDMGLGKTISTLALLLSRPSHNKARKTTLIVGPVALIKQWEREIVSKIVSSHRLSTFVYHSGKKATWSTLRTYDVVLTTYGTLAAEYKRYVDLEKRKVAHPGMDDGPYQSTLPFLGKNSRWYRVVLDEAQCIKNRNTKSAQAASLLDSQTRFCLTGTPMMNGVHELYSLIHFLKIRPYNEYSRFSAEFSCLTKGTGPEYNMKRAMKKLQAVLKAILLRRTKQSKIDGKPILVLPEKTEMVSNAIFNEDEQEYYTSLERKTQLQFNKYLKAGTIGKNYSNILVLLLRLRQAACHPHLIMDYEEAPTEATAEEMLNLANTLLPDVIGRIMDATVPFECPVCYDPVPNPSIVVPCGHDTCAQCLVKITNSFDQAIANGEDSASAKCPTCRGAVDLKKIIDYETFKRAHMPNSESMMGNADDIDEDSSDSYDSDSDSGLEEADENGNIRNFIVPDNYETSSEEDDDLETGVKAESKPKMETDCKKEVIEYEEGAKETVFKTLGTSDGSDDDLPADIFANFRGQPKKEDEEYPPASKPKPSGSTAIPHGNSKKPHRSKKPPKKKKKGKKPEDKHVSLAELKKKASKSAEGRRQYMRYLKKNWVSSSKIDKCMDILRSSAPDVKTIIFSQFTTLLDLMEVPIHDERIGFGRYDGGMSADARNNAIVRFTDDPRCKVLLVSLKAGNAGLNLVAASQVIILDPFWNPFVEMQAVDRAHRIGQQKPVSVHRILVEGTVEDRIIELQNRKRKFVDAALDENASRSVGRLGREELIYLFGNNDGPGRATMDRPRVGLDAGMANHGGLGSNTQSIHPNMPGYPSMGGSVSKGPADDAKVSVLLQDFANVDEVLTSIIHTSRAWRDAWLSILALQLNAVTVFEEIYNPIVGATSEGHGHDAIMTPETMLTKTKNLKEAYAELKADLLEELNLIDSRIIRPATEVLECIKPIKKTIKNRETKRINYESYQDRVDKKRRQKRSEKEEAGLLKLEADMGKASDEFRYADDRLRESLPPIIAAAFSILPHILAAQILIQNTLLAQYYTTLHNYCTEEGFPSPAPQTQDIVGEWENDFRRIQHDVESINTIARGKAIHSPMVLGDDPEDRRGSSVSGLNLRNNLAARRSNTQSSLPSMSRLGGKLSAGASRISPSSHNSGGSQAPEPQREYDEPEVDRNNPPSQASTPSYSPAGPVRDYFQAHDSQPARNMSSAIAAKKKAPPPPPKRIQSSNEQWVTALYTFTGQENDDLAFEEGDRIKVVKKTDSTDDWWDGELRGVRGRFPANYVEL